MCKTLCPTIKSLCPTIKSQWSSVIVTRIVPNPDRDAPHLLLKGVTALHIDVYIVYIVCTHSRMTHTTHHNPTRFPPLTTPPKISCPLIAAFRKTTDSITVVTGCNVLEGG